MWSTRPTRRGIHAGRFVQSDKTGYQLKAIPLRELTGEPITINRAGLSTWCIVPGKVSGLVDPADVEPKPEGMGVLVFTRTRRAPRTGREDSTMKRGANVRSYPASLPRQWGEGRNVDALPPTDAGSSLRPACNLGVFAGPLSNLLHLKKQFMKSN